MTQQTNSPLANQSSSSKLVLPLGTAASATIDVSTISSVHVIRSTSGWAIKISLMNGSAVIVSYSKGNLDVLAVYVEINYPEGHPESDPPTTASDGTMIDAALDLGPGGTQTTKGAGAEQGIEMEAFSKLAEDLSKNNLSKTPAESVKKTKLG